MPNTADSDSWLRLLSALTDAELRRYGEIARDQYLLERRHLWAQILLGAGALAAAGLGIRSLWLGGFGRSGVLLLCLASVLGYWPYRKALARRLWSSHSRAVREEIGRRGAEAE